VAIFNYSDEFNFIRVTGPRGSYVLPKGMKKPQQWRAGDKPVVVVDSQNILLIMICCRSIPDHITPQSVYLMSELGNNIMNGGEGTVNVQSRNAEGEFYHTGLIRFFRYAADKITSFGAAGIQHGKASQQEELRGPACELMAQSERNLQAVFGPQFIQKGMGDQRNGMLRCLQDAGLDCTDMLPPSVKFSTLVAVAKAFTADYHDDLDAAYGHLCMAGRLEADRTDGGVLFSFEDLIDVHFTRGVSIYYWSAGVKHRQTTLKGGEDFVNAATYINTSTTNHVRRSIERAEERDLDGRQGTKRRRVS